MKHALIALLALCLFLPALAQEKVKESAFDRVIRTGTIRCGYIVYSPYFIKDPNTGEISGIFADITEGIGRFLNLKIEWAEEAGLPMLAEGLRSGRIDALCSGFWANAARGREMDFSRPLFYNGLGIFVRSDDIRFDVNFAGLNSPNVKIAVLDGEMADQIAKSDFPLAQRVALPQLTDLSQLLLHVVTGKADFTIAGAHEEFDFAKNNPEKIKRIDKESPIRTFPNVIIFKKGEQNMVTMVNSAIDELESVGHIDKIITRYEKYPGSFYRVAKPYEVKQ